MVRGRGGRHAGEGRGRERNRTCPTFFLFFLTAVRDDLLLFTALHRARRLGEWASWLGRAAHRASRSRCFSTSCSRVPRTEQNNTRADVFAAPSAFRCVQTITCSGARHPVPWRKEYFSVRGPPSPNARRSLTHTSRACPPHSPFQPPPHVMCSRRAFSVSSGGSRSRKAR